MARPLLDDMLGIFSRPTRKAGLPEGVDRLLPTGHDSPLAEQVEVPKHVLWKAEVPNEVRHQIFDTIFPTKMVPSPKLSEEERRDIDESMPSLAELLGPSSRKRHIRNRGEPDS